MKHQNKPSDQLSHYSEVNRRRGIGENCSENVPGSGALIGGIPSSYQVGHPAVSQVCPGWLFGFLNVGRLGPRVPLAGHRTDGEFLSALVVYGKSLLYGEEKFVFLGCPYSDHV